MEHGSTIGTYVAYGVICLFLLVVTLVLLRTMLLMSLLLLSPARQLWTWLRGTAPGHDPAGRDANALDVEATGAVDAATTPRER